MTQETANRLVQQTEQEGLAHAWPIYEQNRSGGYRYGVGVTARRYQPGVVFGEWFTKEQGGARLWSRSEWNQWAQQRRAAKL